MPELTLEMTPQRLDLAFERLPFHYCQIKIAKAASRVAVPAEAMKSIFDLSFNTSFFVAFLDSRTPEVSLCSNEVTTTNEVWQQTSLGYVMQDRSQIGPSSWKGLDPGGGWLGITKENKGGHILVCY